MKTVRRDLLCWIMLCVGAVAMLILFLDRACAEEKDRSAAAAVFCEDVALLAEESGLSENTWLTELSAAGVRYVIFDAAPDGESLSTLSALGLLPAAAEGLTEGDYAFYLPAADEKPETGLPLAMVENLSRTGVAVSPELDIDAYEGPMVKTLYLYDSYADRYTAADGGQEIENLLFRAVTDRGMRLIVLKPFTTAEGEIISDMDAYTSVLNGLAERVEERGIRFGESFSLLETEPLRPVLMGLCSLLPAALAILLLCEIPVLKKGKNLLCLLAAAVLAGGWYALPELTQKAMMLASAVVFPSAGAVFLWRFFREGWERSQKRPFLLVSAAALAALLAFGLAGGMTVSALMSNRVYLMGGDIFTGVKLALLLPMGLCFVLLAWPMWKDLRRERRLRPWLGMALALLVIAGVYLLLQLRSGDSGAISALENRVRNFLEYSLYARPRTKELLFAAPSVPVFVWACRKKMAPLQLVCGMGACLEAVSVVNTFCHAVAPIRVSGIRSLLAAAIGFVLGLVVTGVLNLVFRKRGEEA
ncbi:MAG: DUF5693 family protein [Oscillospiraceae bacterium]